MEIKVFILLLLYFQLSKCKSFLEDPCGDWATYKDEKCLKIFDQDLVTYTDAENICKNEEGSALPSINTEEEQRFIENLLKSQKVVDNVWIGLKYSYLNQSYIWADGNEADYTHWASGSPKNDSNHCVQMEAEEDIFGYWADTVCTKKNIVMCEKIQLWSLSKIQSTLINVVRNPVPIGFIYVQLPKEKSPQEVWPGLEWEDVSSDYAGLFFRAEGGDSASFGEIQNGESPRLATVKYQSTSVSANAILVPSDGEESDVAYTGEHPTLNSGANHGLIFQLSKSEVRPLNTAVRIWKRTL